MYNRMLAFEERVLSECMSIAEHLLAATVFWLAAATFRQSSAHVAQFHCVPIEMRLKIYTFVKTFANFHLVYAPLRSCLFAWRLPCMSLCPALTHTSLAPLTLVATLSLQAVVVEAWQMVSHRALVPASLSQRPDEASLEWNENQHSGTAWLSGGS